MRESTSFELPPGRTQTAAANAAQVSEERAIFTDARSREVIGQLDRVAPSAASVLIVGETGTGKEVIARQIHERSGRSGPFVAVNCGALSETLGEAALFGHEAGAYTGASGARAGWFEAANGGTLFLDEIGDLPMTLQVALLRVLQERQVVRLGSRKTIPIDVRIVAATNVDVGQAVSQSRFRLDLYFRLSVVTLELPPLRERTHDILPLAEHFIRLHSSRLQLRAPQLDAEARQTLLNYSWPGNVRELDNVIHGAVLVCNDATIRKANLRLISWAISASSAARETTVESVERDSASADLVQAIAPHLERLFDARPDQLFENVESLVIRRALAHCHGNQVHTAKLLGISRNVLRTYLKRFALLGAQPPSRDRHLRVVESPPSPHTQNSPSLGRYPVHYERAASC